MLISRLPLGIRKKWAPALLVLFICVFNPFKTQRFKCSCSTSGELRDSTQFAEHTWTSHFISKHRAVYLDGVTLDVPTDNTQSTGRGVRAASSLRR